jgi:hypothetical protein
MMISLLRPPMPQTYTEIKCFQYIPTGRKSLLILRVYLDRSRDGFRYGANKRCREKRRHRHLAVVQAVGDGSDR